MDPTNPWTRRRLEREAKAAGLSAQSVSSASANPAPQAAPHAAPQTAPQAAPHAAPQTAPQAAPHAAPQASPQTAPQAAPQQRQVVEVQRSNEPKVLSFEEKRKARMERHLEKFDVINARFIDNKQGEGGRKINLLTNYFKVKLTKLDTFVLQCHVDFTPEIELISERKTLLKPHEKTIGSYVFDGAALFIRNRLSQGSLKLYSVRKNGERIEIHIRQVGDVKPSDPSHSQFANIIKNKVLEKLKLVCMSGNYYDKGESISLHQWNLELWPGIKTNMRQRENEMLLCVDSCFKVLRTDSVLEFIKQKQTVCRGRNAKDVIRNSLAGCIVVTRYNGKTYRVNDICFDDSPAMKFEIRKGVYVSLAEYMFNKYQLKVEAMQQPLLKSLATEKSIRGGRPEPVLLLPEFCYMTGLTQEQKENMSLMRDVQGTTNLKPDKRHAHIKKYVSKLLTTPDARQELDKWGLQIDNDFVPVTGRQLDSAEIFFGGGKTLTVDANNADFTDAFRVPKNKKMYDSVKLTRWVVVVSSRDASRVHLYLQPLIDDAKEFGFYVSNPLEQVTISNPSTTAYNDAINKIMAKYKGQLQFMLFILPKQSSDIYSEIKRLCLVDFGVASQCILAKHMNKPKTIRAIMTKVIIQINAKLGGQPWTVLKSNEIEKIMVAGFDVYHSGSGMGRSVGAIVSSLNSTCSRFFSCVSHHARRQEVSTEMGMNFQKCLDAYIKENRALPRHIFFYRDGVGEGQLNTIYKTELENMKLSIKKMYNQYNIDLPSLVFLVVSKRIMTKYLSRGSNRLDNAPPGTIVDTVITLPDRYDFFLVSPSCKISTASPVHYTVLFSQNSKFPPKKVQALTHKLTYGYYNFTGAISVPATCQYAHKLAYLVGMNLNERPVKKQLSNFLYYL